MTENILGKNIRLLRKESKISQLELAKYLNISNTTLSQYESGKRVPGDSIKLKISQYFKVSLDWLMGISTMRNPYINENQVQYKVEKHYIIDVGELPADEIKKIEEYVEFIKQRYYSSIKNL